MNPCRGRGSCFALTFARFVHGRFSLGGKERPVDSVGDFPLHIGQHMTVSVQRDRDRGMAQPITDLLGVMPLAEEQRRVRVAQGVEWYRRKFSLPSQCFEAPDQVPRRDRSAVGRRKDQVEIMPLQSES